MQYMAKQNKSYSSTEEYLMRLGMFNLADKFIKEVNHPDSNYTHTAAHNKFSDWTSEEYQKLLSPTNMSPRQETTLIVKDDPVDPPPS